MSFPFSPPGKMTNIYVKICVYKILCWLSPVNHSEESQSKSLCQIVLLACGPSFVRYFTLVCPISLFINIIGCIKLKQFLSYNIFTAVSTINTKKS